MPSVSAKQHRFMAAVAHNPKFAKQADVPVSVGQDFMTADKGIGIRRMADGGEPGIVERMANALVPSAEAGDTNGLVSGYAKAVAAHKAALDNAGADIKPPPRPAAPAAPPPPVQDLGLSKYAGQTDAQQRAAAGLTWTRGRVGRSEYSKLTPQERTAYEAAGFPPPGMANGGKVSGPGGPTDDRVPAMLSPDEYVLPADTTKAIGVGTLNAIKDATHTPSGKPAWTPGGIRRHADGTDWRDIGKTEGTAVKTAGNMVYDILPPVLLASAWNMAQPVISPLYSGFKAGLTGSDEAAAANEARIVAANANVMAGGTGESKGFDTSKLPNPASVQAPTGTLNQQPVAPPQPETGVGYQQAEQLSAQTPGQEYQLAGGIYSSGNAPITAKSTLPSGRLNDFSGTGTGPNWEQRNPADYQAALARNASDRQALLSSITARAASGNADDLDLAGRMANAVPGGDAAFQAGRAQRDMARNPKRFNAAMAQSNLQLQQQAEARQAQSSAIQNQSVQQQMVERGFGIQQAARLEALRQQLATMPPGQERDALMDNLGALMGKQKFVEGRPTKVFNDTGQIVSENANILNAWTGKPLQDTAVNTSRQPTVKPGLAVGAKTTQADGVYDVPDGRTATIKNGVVVEIK